MDVEGGTQAFNLGSQWCSISVSDTSIVNPHKIHRKTHDALAMNPEPQHKVSLDTATINSLIHPLPPTDPPTLSRGFTMASGVN